MPTLPALTMRVRPTMRSNCMWVWPHTTSCTPSESKIGRSFSSVVVFKKISVSFRGVAWQKTTRPMPSIVSSLVSGQLSMHRRSSGLSCAAFHFMASWKNSGTGFPTGPRAAAALSRSPLPMMKSAGMSSERSRSSVSLGMGPGRTSPPTTMRSTRAWRTSASTASKAGKLP